MKNNFLNFLQDKESRQKGVVLLVAFVVMGIAVALVLGVSIILLSELKVIRGMGNSVVAFYAADTGIEKTLYYDRKVKDATVTRGICNICDSCPDCTDCSTLGGSGCAVGTCTNCQIDYTTNLTNKIFKMTVTILPGNDTYQSYGTFKGVTRAIELSGN